MTTIDLGSCHAEIGENLWSGIGEKILASGAEKNVRCAVITDTHVAQRHLEKVKSSLVRAGIECCDFIIEPGEFSKSLAVYGKIVAFLAERHFTRSDAVIALGGGIVGDLAGFAASTFLRGVRFFQLPTTLLAMIDSSIGGKCAVNLETGKNLCGTFYPAEKIFADIAALKTLPPEIFADGAAEAVKYGMIADAELFDRIAGGALVSETEKTIARCVSIKAEIVAHDLFDRGERRLLNFGHTVGHALEIASNFALSHGRAVAIGMAEVSRAAVRRNLCDDRVASRLESCLKKLHLPTASFFPAAQLAAIILNDKKRHGQVLEMVVPRKIGHAELYPVKISELEKFFA